MKSGGVASFSMAQVSNLRKFLCEDCIFRESFSLKSFPLYGSSHSCEISIQLSIWCMMVKHSHLGFYIIHDNKTSASSEPCPLVTEDTFGIFIKAGSVELHKCSKWLP